MKRLLARLLLSLVGVALVAMATYELIHAYRHVYEPNARVEAEFTVLSSSVNGTIASISVTEGARVNAGQRLAAMEVDVARLDVESMEAELEKERAVRLQAEAELTFFHTELDDRIGTAKASLQLRAKELVTLQERERIAGANVARTSTLLNRSAVSRQGIEDAQDKLLDITSKIRDLETQIAVDEMRLRELYGQKRRDAIHRSRISVVDRNIDRLEVLIAQIKQKMREMDIFSPIDGVVNEIYENAGAYVEDGDRVFLLHDPARMWIEADVDEAGIRHVKTGQRVRVELDAYPFEEFAGRVRSIGHVTRANISRHVDGATAAPGTQRIPVIIDFSAGERAVWPGMRAAVNIVIR
jgi:membrane fusion protein (multidrug efflux system)